MAKPISWTKTVPKTKKARRALMDKCGARAFLDPKWLKFPIVGKHAGCKPSCSGLEAAFKRARQYHRAKIAKKARQLAKRAKCAWLS